MKKLQLVLFALLIVLATSCVGGGSTSKPFVAGAGGTSQPVIPKAWTVANWWFDPANSSGVASDNNDCQTISTPCSTWGEIWVHRLGDSAPMLQQPTTFHQMSSQTLNVDPIFGTFRLQNGAQAILIGTLTQVCTIAINTATVTAQVRGGPGTRWAVSAPCAGEVAKTLLQDTTQSPTTWSTIDTVAGSATISQPISNTTITTVGIPTLTAGTMATNDAFTVWSQPLSNLKSWRGVSSGDVGAGGANTSASVAWVQGIEVADSSGTGASELPVLNDGALTVFSNVRFDSRVHVAALSGRGNQANFIGDDFSQAFLVLTGVANMSGGIARAGTTIEGGGVTTFSLDAVMHGSNTFLQSSPTIASTGTFADGTTTIANALVQDTGPFWGSGAITMDPGAVWWSTSAFATNLLTSGALQFGAINTGFTSPNCGTFTNNGVTQVDTTPAGGSHWPAGSTFAISLNTVGGTACLAGGPYFSAAVTADNLFTKAVTVNCNDVYNYCAQPASVSITAANIDLYRGLQDYVSGARFTITN